MASGYEPRATLGHTKGFRTPSKGVSQALVQKTSDRPCTGVPRCYDTAPPPLGQAIRCQAAPGHKSNFQLAEAWQVLTVT